MNISANNHQTPDTTTTVSATWTGLLRRCMAGALMAAAITATALGVAATSHADTSGVTPSTHPTTTPHITKIDGFGNGMPGYRPTRERPHHRHAN
ncbi:MAG TPA: hypothetical protein VMU34_09985 [Mycobacterium sp.]|nr:hypothetical protein [Mycobacterium sp.]